MHPFWEIVNKEDKTDLERAVASAVVYLSVREGFTHLTPEDIYDKLIDKPSPLLLTGIKEAELDVPSPGSSALSRNEGLNPKGPHYF